MNTDERSYLSIGEVLSILQDEFPDITISKIRFLESQGLIDPERTASGYRKFYDADLERLRFILREQKDHYLPLRVIKDRLDDGEIGAPATPVPSPNHPTQRVPAWMAEARPPKPRPALTADTPAAVTPLLGATSGASFTAEELADAAGLSPAQLADVERFGLLAGKRVGQHTYYDEDALLVAKLAAGFLQHGLEARHLRMFRNAAEREAGLYEQVIIPLVKQRNPQARAQANAALNELAHLGDRLRTAMLRQALKTYTD